MSFIWVTVSIVWRSVHKFSMCSLNVHSWIMLVLCRIVNWAYIVRLQIVRSFVDRVILIVVIEPAIENSIFILLIVYVILSLIF